MYTGRETQLKAALYQCPVAPGAATTPPLAATNYTPHQLHPSFALQVHKKQMEVLGELLCESFVFLKSPLPFLRTSALSLIGNALLLATPQLLFNRGTFYELARILQQCGRSEVL